MTDDSSRPRPGRENRLLLITIIVSIAVLLLLARFRFPDRQEADSSMAPPPLPALTPLERLATRATYDELASIVTQLSGRLAPSLLVLRVSGPRDSAVPITADTIRSSPPGGTYPRWAPAIRVTEDIAITWLETHARVQGILGDQDAVPVVLGSDPLQGLAIVRIPPVPDPGLGVWETPPEIDSPRYVVVVEGTRGGPLLRPVFIGRTHPITDLRWEQPILELDGVDVAPGSLLFSLDGRLIGLAIPREGGLALAPAGFLAAAHDHLLSGTTRPAGDLGIQVQSLTPALAAATGADHGAVVSFVEPTSPADGLLEVGDVIRAVNDRDIFSAERLIVTITRLAPGASATLQVVRRGTPLDLETTVRALEPDLGEPGPDDLGLSLRDVAGLGAEVVRVAPRSAAARAGLTAGDVIVQIDGTRNPTGRQVTRAYAQSSAGSKLLVGVERNAVVLLLALERPTAEPEPEGADPEGR